VTVLATVAVAVLVTVAVAVLAVLWAASTRPQMASV
jgi:hypothetical protein